MAGSVKESDLKTDGPDSEIKRAITFMGGYRKSSSRLNLYASKKHQRVTMFLLQKWVKCGEIEPQYGRVALVIESVTGFRFTPEKLCPKIFEDWRTL